MDQFQLLKLLQGSIDQLDCVRNESLQLLDQTFRNLDDMNPLFNLIIEKNQLAEIYFNYWLIQHNDSLDLNQYSYLRAIITQIYSDKNNKGIQIRKALRFILLKQQQDLELIQWIINQKDIELLYYLLKELFKEEGDSQRVQYLCQQSQSMISDNALEISLKLVVLTQKIIKNAAILEFEKYLGELEKQIYNNNFRVVYLIQKIILSKLTYNKDFSLESLSQLLFVLNKIYFTNQHLKQIQLEFVSEQQFKNDIQNLKDLPNQQNKLVLQVLKILKLLLQNHTYDPLLALEQINQNGLEFELVLFEGYFSNILKFLIQYALILSPAQVYDIYYDQEEAYAENNNSSYEIRDTAIDFLIASLQSHKADDVIQIMNDQFQQTPELKTFQNVIQKEAIYYLIRNVMLDMQFDMDQYIVQFQQELQSTDALFDPLKIQILQIFIKYLKYNEQIPEDISQIIINLILTLQTTNKCIILLQIECLNQLIEIIDQPSKFWPNIQQLYSNFQNQESKICIFNFYSQLTKKDQFSDHSWIIKQFYQEWQGNNLNIQEKIIETLIEIIFRSDKLAQHIEVCIFIIQQIFSSKQQILIEMGTELLLMFLSQCQVQNIQISNEFAILVQNILKSQLVSQSEFWIQSVLIQTFLLYLKSYDDQLMRETLLMQVQQYSEIKDEPYEHIFIPLNIYIQLNQKSHKEFGLMILNYMMSQSLTPILLIKLGNFVSLINDIVLEDQINSQILQAHLLQKEFQLVYFQNFHVLLQRSNSHFTQHCQQILEEQSAKHLESNKHYIISELRPLLGNRRLRLN
ncbi:unnamed protein product [Paramecium octaurelia]|uniref:Uncharacterized protein n=1 Tax=Paramecium octaurelia TaxID=43137 RepID=A0A8S1TND9_PAROT|nr:unnamed protein product [Paramecium octaurelia]